jgi:hypothetical protein
MLIDLSSGVAHSALSAGTATFGTGTLTIDANAGVFTLTHGTQTTGWLQFSAAAAEIQAALAALTSIGSGNVTVTAGAAGVFTIAFGGSITDTALTTNADPATGTGSGLVKFGTATTTVTFSNMEGAQGSGAGDVMLGDAEANTFYFTEESGNALVYSNGGKDVLNFTKLSDEPQVTPIDGGFGYHVW